MKTTTITKYTTSDGKNFNSLEAAQMHELASFFQREAGADVKVTSLQMLRTMASNPGAVIKAIEDASEVK